MIHITSIKSVNPKNYDEVWAITRSNKIPPYCINIPQLSPDWNLFNLVSYYKKQGFWCKFVFSYKYVPTFITNLIKSKESLEYLIKLIDLDKSNKSIALVCFCDDESMCHRSIIGGILEGLGCRVRYDRGKSYINYYNIYKTYKEIIENEC